MISLGVFKTGNRVKPDPEIRVSGSSDTKNCDPFPTRIKQGMQIQIPDFIRMFFFVFFHSIMRFFIFIFIWE